MHHRHGRSTGLRTGRLLFIALASLCFGAPASAAAPLPKTLRTLVYDVAYDATISRVTRDSGIGTAIDGYVSGRSESGVRTYKIVRPDIGTMTIDVLAATADGGLVLEESYSGKVDHQLPVQLSITPDGAMRWNERDRLSPMALRVLPMFSRGLVGGRMLEAGAAWNAPVAPPATGTAHYKVRGMKGTIADLDIEYSMHVPLPINSDETGQASAIYETFRVCPLQYTVHSVSHAQLTPEESNITELHLTARLVSDSLADAKP